MTPRMTMAPKIPYLSTRGWSSAGTAKYWKIRMKTNRLSTESDSSIRYPV